MTEVSTSTSGCKSGRPQSEGSIGTKQKVRVSFEELDLAKDLSLWKKPELQAYLSHYGMKKSGNKPELTCPIRGCKFPGKNFYAISRGSAWNEAIVSNIALMKGLGTRTRDQLRANRC